ncbi:hypothetical protein EVAR_64493_1 [Eumeta japonica]|uniref:Uncharacterized protein n=1 Tax=Eumeta variegata TaxID=151549 RepID=A0A4C2A5H1_EUMVA|nr:hypothetical protein EVAR_64493_1 [Eumeta japonica]
MQEIVPRNKIARTCRPRSRATPRFLAPSRSLTATGDIYLRVDLNYMEQTRVYSARLSVIAQVADGIKVTCGGYIGNPILTIGYEKLCSRWIPQNWTGDQKTDHVTWYNAMLTSFKDGALNSAWDIGTGNETWIYCYELRNKTAIDRMGLSR